MKTEIIFGPPGTGKTTKLIEILEQELLKTDPSKIGFFSFTRKGAYEARDRVMEKFNFSKDDLPYFRTLHSLAFFELGATTDIIMKYKHYKELSALLGVNLTSYSSMEEPPSNRFLFLDHLGRNTCKGLKDTWLDWGEEENWHHLKFVIETIQDYKDEKGLFDFTDLVESFIGQKKVIDLEVVFIDEAQDLTTLQWKLVEAAFTKAKRIYIAGDDDQSIYKWAGADVSKFLALKGKFTYLKQSWRIPNSVHKLSQRIVQRIIQRNKKDFKPRDAEGSVRFHNDLDEIELNKESWLYLGRNNYFLKKFEESIRRQGYPYKLGQKSSINQDSLNCIYEWERKRKEKSFDLSKKLLFYLPWKPGKINFDLPWYEAFVKMPIFESEYYRACLRRGGNLKKPNILLSTIHKVKGGQADHVVLLSDMSWKTFQAYQKAPDDEHRVFYVGVTRAKKSLHLIAPEGELAYSF